MAGRPTQYKTEYNKQAYKLSLLGATDKEMSDFFEVSEVTFNAWVIIHSAFNNSIIQGRLERPSYIQKKEIEKANRRIERKKYKSQQNEYQKNSLKSSPQKKIRNNFSTLLRCRLKSKNREKTFDIVGYSVNELMYHLERQFVSGMSWDNYGSVWHIDHKIPDCAFCYQSKEDDDFKKCWALSNLQPLFKFDNLKKGGKYVCS